ncbi:MAG TPA: PfkB family carbohydrate kinase [bacterium]|nr:PfkB family carbohydrate kinase [bacterium]HPG82819.1 PfkB family carbohydrate kinase [bacterium]HPM58675.1 PfkB family carbohydrate kinase [bacterium]
MSLLVVGSMAYDDVITPAAEARDALGGSATFFAAAASYFTPVNLVAVVGEDFKHEEIAFLRERGVDLDGLTVEAGKTFRWKGRYLANMNDRETIYTHLNVFERFDPRLPELYRESEFVFLANISPALQHSVISQVHRPKFVAMDTMNFWITGAPDALRETLKLVDALVVNDSEVRELSGEDNLIIASRLVQQMGPRTLIIKKGEHGALMVHGESYFFCPAFPVARLKDPTGAGDTFAGGLMGYLALSGKVTEENLRRAVVFGTALASFAVEDFSCNRLRSLDRKEILGRVDALRAMTRFEKDSFWPAEE